MTFSSNKKALLGKTKSRALSTFLFALLTAAVMFLPAIIAGKGYFIFYGDFNVQQIPFYQTCHQAIREGNFFWSSITDLGSNFIGAYSFYLLGSPFFWLTIPFPNFMVPYLMGPLLVLKFACAALTAYFYISRFTCYNETARAGALLYAFSAFSVYNIFFNHFHEAIIVFPLLLLCLELLYTENKRGVFALAVCLCALVNYFFFVGMVVFSVIYWLVRVLSGAIKFKFSRFLVLLFEAVLGVCLSAFLLAPSIAMVVNNGRVSEFQNGWSAIMYGKEHIYMQIVQSMFFPPDIPAHPVFVPNMGVKWSSIAVWLPVVGMSSGIGFCASKKGHWIKRVLLVCLFMAFVPFLNSAFYAFNDSYYARWYYMPVLILCLASSLCFEDNEVNWKKGFNISLIITLALGVIIGLFPQKVGEELVFGLYKDAGEKGSYYLIRFLISCIIAVASLLILRGLIALHKNKKMLVNLTALAVCVISAVYGCVFIMQGQQHSSDIEQVMISELIEGEVELDTVPGNDFRIDVYDGIDNTGMYLGYNSINAFHSVVSPSIMEFYDYIGIKRDVASRPGTDYLSIRSLLSVKYLINRTSGVRFIDSDGVEKMQGFNYIKTSGGYYVYENENYIPYGFYYNSYITEKECELLYEDKKRADIMLKALVVPDGTSAEVLGSLPHYNTVISENELLESNEEYLISNNFDYETIVSDVNNLKLNTVDSFYFDKNQFFATCNNAEDQLVFFAVPYDKGWNATVNGQKAEIIRANVGFMAVKVPSGQQSIVFTYTPPMLYMGITISVVAVAVFAVYMLIVLITVKKRKQTEYYPEGNDLLEFWAEDLLDVYNQAEEKENYLDDLDNVEIPQNTHYKGGFVIDLTEFSNEEEESNK